MSDLEITFTCKKCGGHVLELPDDYTDESIAKCKSCECEFGPYGDVKSKAIELAKEKIVGDFKKSLGKGWKFSKR